MIQQKYKNGFEILKVLFLKSNLEKINKTKKEVKSKILTL